MDLQESTEHFAGLVRRYLGLDPELVIRVGAGAPPTEVETEHLLGDGLRALLFRSMMTFAFVRYGDDARLRLETDESARLKAFPDATTANYALGLVWGLSHGDRAARGLPPMVLTAAQPGKSGSLRCLPAGVEWDETMPSIADLVSEILDERSRNIRFRMDPVSRRIPRGDRAAIVLGSRAIRDILHLDPGLVASSVRDVGGADLEEAAHAGLDRLIRSALQQFDLLHRSRGWEIRLMSEGDARKFRSTDAHHANVCTVLACGLHGSGGADLEVLPARKHAVKDGVPDGDAIQRDALLNAFARWGAREGTFHARDALAFLLEDSLHVDLAAARIEADHMISYWDKE